MIGRGLWSLVLAVSKWEALGMDLRQHSDALYVCGQDRMANDKSTIVTKAP